MPFSKIDQNLKDSILRKRKRKGKEEMLEDAMGELDSEKARASADISTKRLKPVLKQSNNKKEIAALNKVVQRMGK